MAIFAVICYNVSVRTYEPRQSILFAGFFNFQKSFTCELLRGDSQQNKWNILANLDLINLSPSIILIKLCQKTVEKVWKKRFLLWKKLILFDLFCKLL